MWWQTAAAVGAAPTSSLDGLLAPFGGLSAIIAAAYFVVREYGKGRREAVADATKRQGELETELGDAQDKVRELRAALEAQASDYEARLQRMRDVHSEALLRAYGDVDEAHIQVEASRAREWRVRDWCREQGHPVPANILEGTA